MGKSRVAESERSKWWHIENSDNVSRSSYRPSLLPGKKRQIEQLLNDCWWRIFRDKNIWQTDLDDPKSIPSLLLPSSKSHHEKFQKRISLSRQQWFHNFSLMNTESYIDSPKPDPPHTIRAAFLLRETLTFAHTKLIFARLSFTADSSQLANTCVRTANPITVE